jgi:hypothetical protein
MLYLTLVKYYPKQKEKKEGKERGGKCHDPK